MTEQEKSLRNVNAIKEPREVAAMNGYDKDENATGRPWQERWAEMSDMRDEVCAYPPRQDWAFYFANIIPNLFDCLELAKAEVDSLTAQLEGWKNSDCAVFANIARANGPIVSSNLHRQFIEIKQRKLGYDLTLGINHEWGHKICFAPESVVGVLYVADAKTFFDTQKQLKDSPLPPTPQEGQEK